MFVPGIVASGRNSPPEYPAGLYTPCDDLETAYEILGGGAYSTTEWATDKWTATQFPTHATSGSSLEIDSIDNLYPRTEDIDIFLNVSVDGFSGTGSLYIIFTYKNALINSDIVEVIPETPTIFTRTLPRVVSGPLRIELLILGDCTFDAINLHRVFTAECIPACIPETAACYTAGDDLETSFVAYADQAVWDTDAWISDPSFPKQVAIETVYELCPLAVDKDISVTVVVENYGGGAMSFSVALWDENDDVLDSASDDVPETPTAYTLTIPSGTTGNLRVVSSVVGLMAVLDGISIQAIEGI